MDLVSVIPSYWSTEDICAIKKNSKKGLRISYTKMGVNPHEILGRN